MKWTDCPARRYLLPSGDSGIIRTIDEVVYITRVQNDTLYCLDRSGKVRRLGGSGSGGGGGCGDGAWLVRALWRAGGQGCGLYVCGVCVVVRVPCGGRMVG
jgi:hypothetical protein